MNTHQHRIHTQQHTNTDQHAYTHQRCKLMWWWPCVDKWMCYNVTMWCVEGLNFHLSDQARRGGRERERERNFKVSSFAFKNGIISRIRKALSWMFDNYINRNILEVQSISLSPKDLCFNRDKRQRLWFCCRFRKFTSNSSTKCYSRR